MPKGNKQAEGRPKKPHKLKSIKLSQKLCPIAENSLDGATATIELGLLIIEYLSKQAVIGDEAAIELLAHFGVEAKVTEVAPIVVYRSDGEVSAWIV